MTSITEITKLTGCPATGLRLSGASSLSLATAVRGTGLSGAGLFGGGRLFGGAGERPVQAPAAEAAVLALGYASAADGAGFPQQDWDSAANGDTTAVTKHHRKMRAFRGLEPWRDPA
ncbi:hypothetical protein [Streptomyces sp. ICBB 8177]|uniref:hypothetical protein n=1 Tax=Streptomyces sp. ICBB 8177 TaxID=563922 RepID=UPI000D675827|nr:hypothetical protein [Streptomyces sp. ICBB 8177]PWI44006.1 hypothetical protein CK485_18345 [Streptomyces sp. ICBB 8177]